MLAFILRRLIQAVIVMASVAFIAFMLFQYVGDPVVFVLGQDAKPEEVREVRAALGLDKPFLATRRRVNSALACARPPRCRG
jgi:peptide/nickel transport system permease protein